MKRSHLLAACGSVLIGLAVTYSQTPESKLKPFKLTTAQHQEYLQLVKSDSGKAAVEAWARRNKLQILSFKAYSIMVIPKTDLGDHTVPTVEEAAKCDPKNCPVATGTQAIVNSQGKILGAQTISCKAGSCKWIKDSQGRWNRICGSWKCENSGPIEYF